MEESYSLLSLNDFLYRTLAITEELKNVLKFNCEEATFCLKPWCMETVVTKEVSEDACICSKTAPETEVEEIAAGISRALLQTQQLREKLCHNVTKDKKSSKYPDVSSIYNPNSVSSSKHSAKKVVQVTQKNVKSSKTGNSNDKEKDTIKGCNINANVKKDAVNTTNTAVQVKSDKDSNENVNATSSTKHSINKTKEQKGITKQKPKISAGKSEPNLCKNNEEKPETNKASVRSVVKPIKGKDFLAINKSNVRSISQTGKHRNINEKGKNSNSATIEIKQKPMHVNKRVSTASTSELQDLIEKVSSKLNTPPLDEGKDNCPLHGDVSSRFITEQRRMTMDVVESLDRFNIPGHIIKTLKSYHTYTNATLANDFTSTGRNQRTVDKFLAELVEMNDKSIQEHLVNKNQIVHLFMSFASLFSNVFQKNADFTCLDDAKKTYNELSFIWEMYDTKESNDTQVKELNEPKNRCHTISNGTGLMLNGIWNQSDVNHLRGISKAYCIRYVNKNQLLSYFEVMQELQETQYLKDLIGIISKDVIPNIKPTFDPTSPEYIRLYKMIFILCQGLNPQVPTLVKTDD